MKKVRIITLENEINHNQQEKEEFVDVELCQQQEQLQNQPLITTKRSLEHWYYVEMPPSPNVTNNIEKHAINLNDSNYDLQ